MNGAKHTAGPWRIGGDLITANDESGRAIEVATVWGRWRDRRDAPPEPIANANRRLIAAAPALLAALKALRGAAARYEDDRDLNTAKRAADAVIALAEPTQPIDDLIAWGQRVRAEGSAAE